MEIMAGHSFNMLKIQADNLEVLGKLPVASSSGVISVSLGTCKDDSLHSAMLPCQHISLHQRSSLGTTQTGLLHSGEKKELRREREIAELINLSLHKNPGCNNVTKVHHYCVKLT